MILRNKASHRYIVAGFAGRLEDRRQIQSVRLPVSDCALRIEHIDAPDHFVDVPEAEARHDLPSLLRHQKQVIDYVLRLTRKFLAQQRILRGDTDRTRIQMTLAHHDAAERDQWRRRKAHFLCAQQGRDDDIAPSLQASIGL